MTMEEKVAQMVQISYSMVSEESAHSWAKLLEGVLTLKKYSAL